MTQQVTVFRFPQVITITNAHILTHILRLPHPLSPPTSSIAFHIVCLGSPEELCRIHTHISPVRHNTLLGASLPHILRLSHLPHCLSPSTLSITFQSSALGLLRNCVISIRTYLLSGITRCLGLFLLHLTHILHLASTSSIDGHCIGSPST